MQTTSRILLAAIAVLCICVLVPVAYTDSGEKEPGEPRTNTWTTEKYVAVGDGWVTDRIVVSSDGKHFGAVAKVSDEECYAIIDGVRGSTYKSIFNHDIKLSADEARFAYIAQEGRDFFVVSGEAGTKGTEGPRYISITRNTLSLSSDGKRLAYIATDSQGRFYVVGTPGKTGKEGARYTRLKASIRFSADGSRHAYIASDEEGDFYIIDGSEELRYADLGGLVFSPDGANYAYAAAVDKEMWFINYNGEEREDTYQELAVLGWSADGKRFVYRYKTNDSYTFVVEEKSRKREYPDVIEYIAKPGEEPIAVRTKKGTAFAWVVNGETVYRYDETWLRSNRGAIKKPYFTDDRSRYILVDSDQRGAAKVTYGERTDDVTGVITSLTFSTDSSRFAYAVKNQGAAYVMVDGEKGPEFAAADVKGRSTGIFTLAFSPDSKHIAYIASSDSAKIVVDGNDLGDFTRIIGPDRDNRIFWDSDTKFHFIALDDSKLRYIEKTVSN